ncbi:MAG: hypothetical protein ACLFUF_04435 [Opitutales bacterium]
MRTFAPHLFLPGFLIFALAFVAAASAQEDPAVEVDRVDFDSTNDDWTQMEIELAPQTNPDPEARDEDYIEDIKVKAYLAYPKQDADREFDYYTSEVEIIILERREDANVYFYLPGLIVERDRLKEEPEFWYVEIEVAGETQQPQEEGMSRNIQSPEVLESFLERATGEAKTDVLMPVYYAPADAQRRVEDLPAFRRSDMRGLE